MYFELHSYESYIFMGLNDTSFLCFAVSAVLRVFPTLN